MDKVPPPLNRTNSDADSSSTGPSALFFQTSSGNESISRKEERASLLKGKVVEMRALKGLGPDDVKTHWFTQTFHSSLLEAKFVNHFYLRGGRMPLTMGFFIIFSTVSLIMDFAAFNPLRGNDTRPLLTIALTVRLPSFLVLLQGVVFQSSCALLMRLLGHHTDKNWKKRRIWNLVMEIHYFLTCFLGTILLIFRQAIYGSFGFLGFFPSEATSTLLLSNLVSFPRICFAYFFGALFPLIVVCYIIFNPVKSLEGNYWISFVVLFGSLCASIILMRFVEKRIRLSFVSGLMAQLEKECAKEELSRSSKLKENIFPLEYAEGFTLARQQGNFFHKQEYASILFSDIKGFSAWCKGKKASYIVEVLNMQFSLFDESSELLGITKCKTIGDAFVAMKRRPDGAAVSSSKTPILSRQKSKGSESKLNVKQSTSVELGYVLDMIQFGILMHRFMRTCNLKKGEDLSLRVGISVGEVECMIFGQSAITFDLFGDHAEYAEHLEAKGIAGCVHVSNKVRELAEEHYEFVKKLDHSPEKCFADMGSTWIVKCKRGEPEIISVTLNGIFPRNIVRRESVVQVDVSPAQKQTGSESFTDKSVHKYPTKEPNMTDDILTFNAQRPNESEEQSSGNTTISPPSISTRSPSGIPPPLQSPSTSTSSLLKHSLTDVDSNPVVENATKHDPSKKESASGGEDPEADTTNPYPLISSLTLLFFNPRTMWSYLRHDYTASLSEIRTSTFTYTFNLLMLFISVVVRDTDRVFLFTSATRNLFIIVGVTLFILLLAIFLCLVMISPLGRLRLVGYSLYGTLFIMHLLCTAIIMIDKKQYETHYEIFALWLLYLNALLPFPIFWVLIISSLSSVALNIAGFFLGMRLYSVDFNARGILIPIVNLFLILLIRGFMISAAMRSFWFKREIDKQLKMTRKQQEENDALILSVLPPRVAKRMEDDDGNFSEELTGTVAFLYLCGFDKACDQNLEASFTILNELFSHFDSECRTSGVHKVKSIRSAYMLYSDHSDHAELIAELVLEFTEYVQQYMSSCTLIDQSVYTLRLTSGINSGPLVGGVLGRRSFLYDVFSSTVNQTQRLAAGASRKCIADERTSCILISAETKDLLESNCALVDINDEEDIEAKGFGMLHVYSLKRAAVTLEIPELAESSPGRDLRQDLNLEGIDMQMVADSKRASRKQSVLSVDQSEHKLDMDTLQDNLETLQNYSFPLSGVAPSHHHHLVDDDTANVEHSIMEHLPNSLQQDGHTNDTQFEDSG